MNLVLLSTMDKTSNIENMQKVFNELTLINPPEKTSIGYLSYHTDSELTRFNITKERYSQLGYSKFKCFVMDSELNINTIEEVLNCNLIHIPGGNTFDLLNLLRKHQLIDKLRLFAKKGGTLVGVSAGGICITPNISVASFADSNDINITDFNSLNLVSFIVKPHWQYWNDKADLFEKLNKLNNIPIYTLEDGEAIIVKNNVIKPFIDSYRNNTLISI